VFSDAFSDPAKVSFGVESVGPLGFRGNGGNIFIELMTSDRKLEASREGSK